MKNAFLTLALVCGVFLSASTAEARSVIRVDETVSIAQEQSVQSNYYGVGNTVSVSGVIGGDALVAGRQVTVNGTVASDTFAIALSADIYGDTGGDVRIVGGEVTVGEHITGDLFVIAGTLKVLSSATIDGDIIFFGQEAEIAGSVGHNIMGKMTSLRIDGPIGGDVNVSVGTITLGDRAEITGALQYASVVPVVRAPGAVVSGDVVQNEGVPVREGDRFRTVLEVTLALLFATLTWFLLLRRSLEELVKMATVNYVRSGLVGLAVILVMPFLGGLLIASQLGLLLGIIVFVLYLFLVCAAAVSAVAVAGGFIRMLIMPRSTFSILWILAGAGIVALLLYAPAIVAVFLFLLLTIALGALTERIYHLVR